MKDLPKSPRPGLPVVVQEGRHWHVGPNPCPSSNVPGLGTSTHLTPAQCDCRWYVTEEEALAAQAAWPNHDLSGGSDRRRWEHLRDLSSMSRDSLGALDQLDVTQLVIEHAEMMQRALVTKARQDGESWGKIGASLGMSKQAAQQRYGAKPSTKVDDPAQMQISDDE